MPPQAMDRIEVDHTLSAIVDSGTEYLPKVKCVLVGDGAVGKTSLVVSYTTNGYPTEYVPTAFDHYSVVVKVDNQPIRLQLCDTAGQDDFDKLRPLCYPKTDVFLVCFSVVSPTSFHNIDDKWLPEIRKHCPKSPIILVGTQCDLRNDVKVLIELSHYGECPITENDAKLKVQQTGMHCYVECSALTQKNMKEVFDSVILAALEQSDLKKMCKGSKRKKGKKGKDKSAMQGKDRMREPEQEGQNIHSLSSNSKSNKGWKKFCCFI